MISYCFIHCFITSCNDNCSFRNTAQSEAGLIAVKLSFDMVIKPLRRDFNRIIAITGAILMIILD